MVFTYHFLMADVEKLRDKIVELASDPAGLLRGKFNPNDLHARISRLNNGDPPVARATFYTWFGQRGVPAKQALLECVPAFAKILGVPEYELWQAAGILPPQMKTSQALASAAHDIRAAHRAVRKTLAESGLSTAGEALVVDRIMHAKLDFQIRVWPVVRGVGRPLHLHSWIVLEPIPDEGSMRRLKTSRLDGLDPEQRRAFIREEVVTVGLWRTLGLKWRDKVPAEYAHLGPQPLFIEVPVEERNRPIPPERMHSRFQADRILVLGVPWAHAELLAALLAEALQFGSSDLRYLGFPSGREAENKDKERFCRERLAEAPSQYVWAIAQRSDMMARLRPDLLKAAPQQLVVVVTYGPGIGRFAAQALRTRPGYIERACLQVDDLASEVEALTDVVRVHIEDTDVMTSTGDGAPTVDRHLMTDRIRYLAAGVLNTLYEKRFGPGLPLWGDRFEDLRHADEPMARIPPGDSSVRWVPRTHS
jgi:hypothetical protein